MAENTVSKIGFIGLGNMGNPMILRLLGGGIKVYGFDKNPEAGAALSSEAGFTRSESVEDLAAEVGAVILMLPNSAIVEAVVVGAGLFDSLADGSMVIDMSSSKPQETLRMAEIALAKNIRYVDAPVSGGVPAARKGTLTIMAGGTVEDVAEITPALSFIGTSVIRAGDVGSGHALKAINNLLSASSLIASSEALVVGSKFGLDPAVMMEAINASSGRSWSTLTKWPRNIIPRNFASGFQMSLLVKDTRIAVELARDSGIPVPHAELTLKMWQEALDSLTPDADHTEMHRYVEINAGYETPKNEDVVSPLDK